MPTISRAEPTINIRIVPVGIGTRITLAINTIADMGRTDV
jgi:hypothetical protein